MSFLGTKIDTRVRSTLLDSCRAADYPWGVRKRVIVTLASAFVLRKRVMVTLLTYFEIAYEVLGTKVDNGLWCTLLDSRVQRTTRGEYEGG